MPLADTEFAPAKVNLTLHVTGRRSDGYHLLDSLVVFPRIGDQVAAQAAPDLGLAIDGPFGQELDPPGTLVRAGARLNRREGSGARLRLTKTRPVARGIGGGSSDAAATLRMLARLWSVALPPADAVLGLGADVPVCLAARPARMSGIGEVLAPVELPSFWLVLCNPGVPLATAPVFRALKCAENPPMTPGESWRDLADFCHFLRDSRNDLEAPAIALAPVIAEVLAALARCPGCRLARMSGSGATCFGVFGSAAAAQEAARALGRAAPGWWVAAAPVD
jgi:4-diphosphocytidyl-2-C-methyl-D-erythritol kinase